MSCQDLRIVSPLEIFSDNENLTILDASTNASLAGGLIQVQVAHRF
jgi:hypothetical protein